MEINKWLSTNMLFVYGIIGVIATMISALGTIGVVLNLIGLVAAIAGAVTLVRSAMHHEAKTSSWVLLVVYVVLYYVSYSVAFG